MPPRPRRKPYTIYSGRGLGQTVPKEFIPAKSQFARKDGHKIVEVNGRFFLVPRPFFSSRSRSHSSSRSSQSKDSRFIEVTGKLVLGSSSHSQSRSSRRRR